MERNERTTAALTQYGDDILKLWEPEDLFDVARQVEAMTDTPGWRAVMDLIDRARERALARLLHGGTRSEAQLRHDMGLLAGMDQAVLAAHAIVEGAERVRRKHQEETAAGSVAEGGSG